MNSKKFSVSAFLLIISAIFSSCSETIGTMQDFKHNKYPVITSFTCDPSGSAALDPNTPVTLTVEAMDPEGEKLNFRFDSEDGSFSGQSDTKDSSTVTFYSASYLTTAQTVRASVKVTDDKEFPVSQEIEIGSTREGPSLISVGNTPAYISSDSSVNYSFYSGSSGLYKVQVDGSGSATYFYGAMETSTVTIIGADYTGTGDAQMTTSSDGESDVISVVLQDTLGNETSKTFTLTVDNTPPVSSASPASETSTVLTAIPVAISATDTVSGVSKICYTVDGSSPDFSGNGTVVSGSSAAVTVGKNGTAGIGTYTLNYIAMDKCGNTEDVRTAVYYIKTDTAAPGPVTGLLVSRISSDTIVASYTLPSDPDFDHVLVECSGGGGSVISNTSETAECSISGLAADTEYTVTAYALDMYDNSSTSVSTEISTPTSPYSSLMNVYYINDLDDLVALQETSGYWSYYCYLNANITITAISSPTIGNSTTSFSGYFTGNSHTISNLTINNSSASYQGFFGYIVGGTVRNLILTDVSVAGGTNTGGLAGCNRGVISGCSVSGAVTGDGDHVGGLVGLNVYVSSIVSPYIYNCSSSASVTVNGYDYVGGLVGWNRSVDGTAVISNSHASGTVYAPYSGYVGGLVGESYYDSNNYETAEITDCYATGTVTGYQLVGGLVGHNYDIIENCYATGNVSGSIITGGLAGQNYTYGKITNSYYVSSTGEISGGNLTGGLIGNNVGTVYGTSTAYNYAVFKTVTGTYYVGGLIGENSGQIQYAYAKGTLIGTDDEAGCTGGLIGYNGNAISNCYFVGSVSGIIDTGGLIGYNSTGSVTDCSATGDSVTGTGDNTGGLIGKNESNGTISSTSGNYTYATFTNITGVNYVGGLTGYNAASIEYCYAAGSVTGTGNYTGGLVGYNYSNSIYYSYSTGSVAGSYNAGGFAGYVYGSTISNCYSMSDTTLATNVGGFLGYCDNSNVSYCYSAGSFVYNANYGSYGFCGNYASGNIDNTSCFYDLHGSSSGDPYITGISTNNMKILITYTNRGWDFAGETTNGNNDYWSIGSLNGEYPYLTAIPPSE